MLPNWNNSTILLIWIELYNGTMVAATINGSKFRLKTFETLYLYLHTTISHHVPLCKLTNTNYQLMLCYFREDEEGEWDQWTPISGVYQTFCTI